MKKYNKLVAQMMGGNACPKFLIKTYKINYYFGN